MYICIYSPLDIKERMLLFSFFFSENSSYNTNLNIQLSNPLEYYH